MSESIALAHDGLERPYLLHVPAVAPAAPVPLVVELHGRGVDPLTFDRMTGFSALADEAGFALAMPSATDGVWNDGRAPDADGLVDDVSYLAAVIDDAAARARVDLRRVYVVGMSNGATMAGRLACERPGLLSAFAQVAGTAAVAVVERSPPALAKPILQIHGSDDPYMPYDAGRRRGRRARLVFPHALGPCLGVDAWAALWARANGAEPAPEAIQPAPGVTARIWRGASPGEDVVFYRIEGGGHTWPGSRARLPRLFFGRTSDSVDATWLAWEFLSAHTG